MNAVPKYRWIILLITWLAFFVSWIPRMVIPPLVPEMMSSLELGYIQVATLTSGFWLPYVFVQFLIGFVYRRIGVRRTEFVALIFIGVIGLLSGFAKSYIELLIYRIAHGLAAGCIFVPSLAILLRWFPLNEKSTALGLFSTSASIAQMSIIIISPLISTAFGGWRWSFWLTSPPSIVVAFIAFTFLKEPQTTTTLKSEVKQSIKYTFVLKNKNLWLLCATMAGGFCALGGLSAWLPDYLVSLGFTQVAAAALVSLRSIPAVISSPMSGIIADKINKRIPIILTYYILFCVWLLVFAYFNITSAVYFLLLGFVSGGFKPLIDSFIPSIVSPEAVGTAISLENGIGCIGTTLGPLIFALVLEMSHSYSVGFISLLLVLIVLTLPLIPLLFAELRSRLPY